MREPQNKAAAQRSEDPEHSGESKGDRGPGVTGAKQPEPEPDYQVDPFKIGLWAGGILFVVLFVGPFYVAVVRVIWAYTTMFISSLK